MSDTAAGGDREFPQANFVAVWSLAGALASTLGPTPADKLVVEALATRSESDLPGVEPTDEYVVTSDGATILEALPIDHPVGPLVRRVAGPERPGETDVEGADVPDGVTSTVVLAAGLLDEAEDLMEVGVHPRAIEAGYAIAAEAALAELDAAARDLAEAAGDTDQGDATLDPKVRRAVARTAMTGNDVGGLADRLAGFAVDAVDLVGAPTPETFAVRSVRDGSVSDTRLVPGAVLDRSERAGDGMPRRVEDATVLVLDGQEEGGLRTLEVPEGVTVYPGSPDGIAAFEDWDGDRRDRVVARLREHGVDAVFARQGIEPDYRRRLADHGILGVAGVTRLDLAQVARATGARPVLRTEGFDPSDLGWAGTVEERLVDPVPDRRRRRRVVVVDGCPDPGAVAVFLRGLSGQLADQATTGVRKAAAAVAAAEGRHSDRTGVLPGGGAAEMRVAGAVRGAATDHGNRRQLAVEAFADAVETLPEALARNAGRDPLATLADLRAAHDRGEARAGLLFPDGKVGDALAAGVLDPLATRRRVYVAASEVVSLLLSIDDVLPARLTEDPPDPDDAIHEDATEQQQSYLADNDDTRWE